MVIQGERVSKDFVDEWVELSYSFLSEKDIPRRHTSTKAGGAYRYESGHQLCHDRWIIWRVKNDMVELSELSLHLTLSGNGVRLIFPSTTVLAPVTIIEEGLHISVLVATNASVHRLVCPHPSTLQTEYNMGAMPSKSTSIFSAIDHSVLQTSHHFSYIPHDVAPSRATAALSQVGAAVFAFSYPSSDLRLVTLPPLGTNIGVIQTDLCQWTVMQRIWSGISTKSSTAESPACPLSLVMSQIGPDMLLFALCRDLRLRIWSVSSKECVSIESLAVDQTMKEDGNQLLCYKPSTSTTPALLGMHLSLEDECSVRIYTISLSDGKVSLGLITDMGGLELPLVHMALTNTNILTAYVDSAAPRVLSCQYESTASILNWSEANLQDLPDDQLDFDDSEEFLSVCLTEFSELTLCNALTQLGHEVYGAVEEAMDNFVRTHQGMGDIEDQMETFYKECLHYHIMNTTPLSLTKGLLVMEGDVALLRPGFSEDDTCQNMVLSEALKMLEDSIPSDQWVILQSTESDMLQEVARDLILMYLSPQQTASLDAALLSVTNLATVLSGVIDSIISEPPVCSRPTLFRSKSGTECLIRSVGEGVFDAYQLATVILVCLIYIERAGFKENEESIHSDIRTSLLPKCKDILGQFSLLVWVLKQNIEPETDLENLTLATETASTTVLHHYLASRQPNVTYTGINEMTSLIRATLSAIWPGSALMDLPLFLLSSHFNTELQEYYTMTSNPSASLEHVAAQAFAATGDYSTAVRMFISVARRVDLTEPILEQFVGASQAGMGLALQYLIKCMSLLERSGAKAAIVTLANQALHFSEEAHYPLLHSLAFKHALEVEDYDTAYKAMARNPCPAQKNACLRRFVIVMVDAGKLKQLVSYPYHGFKAEIVKVLESKARTADLRHPQQKNFYNLLFAFHIHNKMYQHAAAAAYEHVLRLQTELPGVASLRLQQRGFLAAINCLELLRAQDAWILQPTQYASVRVSVNASPKRDRRGEDPPKTSAKLSLVTVRELTPPPTVKELRAGYVIVDSLLKISSLKPESAKLHNLTPVEVMALLSSCGLYDQAFLVAEYHSLPPPLASLASRCVNMNTHFANRQDIVSGLTDWLSYNTIPCASTLSPTERAWFYLQYKVKGCGDWDSMNTVLKQLLSAGTAPPHWLLELCKKENAPATIRLCAQYNALDLSVELILGYLRAVSGKDPSSYGVANSLHSTQPSVYVPYTVIDQVIALLKQKKDKPSGRLIQDVMEGLEEHKALVSRITEDRLILAAS